MLIFLIHAYVLIGSKEDSIKKRIEKGIEKGIEESKIKIARNAIGMGLNVEQIINLTGLTTEEIEKLTIQMLDVLV